MDCFQCCQLSMYRCCSFSFCKNCFKNKHRVGISHVDSKGLWLHPAAFLGEGEAERRRGNVIYCRNLIDQILFLQLS